MAYDFPASPSTGQVYQGWSYDGEKWVATSIGPNTAGVIAIQVFTANGTYTPSPSMTSCVIECVGGGGGGGGLAAPGGTSTVGGGGGGAGGYSRKLATATVIGTSQTVTVGAGGAGGLATGPTAGSPGGDSSVGLLCIAKGGGGAQPNQLAGAGGGLGTGDFTVKGGDGGYGSSASITTIYATAGTGGRSYFGGEFSTYTGNGAYGGTAGRGYGNGAGGAVAWTVGAANAAVGAPGLVVITEYGMTAMASGAALGNVRYDLPQGLTTNQMAQARANLGDLKKNYVINGGMQISQENGATVLTATGVYPVDMFAFTCTYGAWQVAQTASLTPGGSPNRIQVKVTTADTAMTGAKYAELFTAVEGLRMVDLKAGTTSAKQITVQFGVKAPQGTYGVSVQNGAANRSYVAEYVIAAGENNIDTIKSVTLTLNDTVGTWTMNNTAGLWVNFTLGVGPTGQATANSWLAGGFFGTSNQFNFMGTVGNTFELFDVGVYEGSVAPPFMVPDYTSELALCQRYFEWVQTCSPGFCPTATIGRTGLQYKVVKRAAPTLAAKTIGAVSINTTAANVFATSFTVNAISADSLYVDVNTSGLTANSPCVVNFTGSNAYLSARL